MNYTRDDYEELYGDHWVTRSSRKTRVMVCLLIVGWIVALLLVAGCDGEAALYTAQAEQEAHQRHVETLMAANAIRRYPPTTTPIRASTLEAKVTACQQLPNRKWECEAQ